jgi:hypothetical protein
MGGTWIICLVGSGGGGEVGIFRVAILNLGASGQEESSILSYKTEKEILSVK